MFSQNRGQSQHPGVIRLRPSRTGWPENLSNRHYGHSGDLNRSPSQRELFLVYSRELSLRVLIRLSIRLIQHRVLHRSTRRADHDLQRRADRSMVHLNSTIPVQPRDNIGDGSSCPTPRVCIIRLQALLARSLLSSTCSIDPAPV